MLKPEDYRGSGDKPSDEYVMLMRRRAILAAVYRLYPMAAAAVGQASPFGGGPYKPMTGWKDGDGTSCTFTNPMVVREAAQNQSLPGSYDIAPASAWRDKKDVLHPAISGHPAWVFHAQGKLPSVGDTYILTGSKENMGEKSYGRFLHVGTILHVDVSKDDVFWVTADGGQNGPNPTGGQAAHLVRRRFSCMSNIPSKPNAPHLWGGAEGDGRRIHGWLDISDSRLAFNDSALQLPSLNDDYLKCGAWIERARAGTP
jgi:hypothetical protein